MVSSRRVVFWLAAATMALSAAVVGSGPPPTTVGAERTAVAGRPDGSPGLQVAVISRAPAAWLDRHDRPDRVRPPLFGIELGLAALVAASLASLAARSASLPTRLDRRGVGRYDRGPPVRLTIS